jgi:transcriptional regulator
MAKRTAHLLTGTLDLLILSVLEEGAHHGYGVARRIEDLSGGALTVEEGSLYPALRRMVEGGYIAADWGVSENNRRARFYRLSSLGRTRLAAETKDWRRFSEGVNRVLGNGVER